MPVVALAQVDSTGVDSLLVPVDSLSILQSDSLKNPTVDTLSAPPKPLLEIQPWVYHKPLNATLVATDSTLRWNIWPSWVYKKNRSPGAISYRMGSIGRTNTFSIYAHQPKYLELYWGDISMNDPVTGMVNWNSLPLHKVSKIYEADNGLTYQTTYRLKEYYLLKPLTKLIYSESKFDFRNLEFMLSRNFGRRTNAEASYWYRAGGGEYKNSSMSGHQIYARVSHQLGNRQKLKFTILTNSYDVGQSFGYFIKDMNTFAFNRFIAAPNQSNANSNRSSSIFSLNYDRRQKDGKTSKNNLHAGLFMRTVKRRLEYSVDTTNYKTREFAINLKKGLDMGPLTLRGQTSFSFFSNKGDSSSSIKTDSWSIFNLSGEAMFQPIPSMQLSVDADYSKRSSYKQYVMGINASLSPLNGIKISAAYTIGTRMPTIQQLYWQSGDFSGNTDLLNEDITEMHIKLAANLFKNTSLSIRTQLKKVDNGIMLVDSTFANINPFSSFSVTAQFNYINSLFEFYGSATYHEFGNDGASPMPLSQEPRIWFKAGAYIKGYLFRRATYVKAGLSGVVSPQPYQAAHYFTPIDYWQPLSEDAFVPAFHRLDLDLSARVRSIMVTLRYENLLDNLFQFGYFETANYPMNRRRLIFGIKVYFRN